VSPSLHGPDITGLSALRSTTTLRSTSLCRYTNQSNRTKLRRVERGHHTERGADAPDWLMHKTATTRRRPAQRKSAGASPCMFASGRDTAAKRAKPRPNPTWLQRREGETLRAAWVERGEPDRVRDPSARRRGSAVAPSPLKQITYLIPTHSATELLTSLSWR
jgi:hypothetical protein